MAQPGAGDGGTPPENDAPWTSDLKALELDDETFAKVDGYMREKVQPHTTKLEQDLATRGEAPDVPAGIVQFHQDLLEDPSAAIKKLATEVFFDNPDAEEIFEVALKYADANPGEDPNTVIEAAGQAAAEGASVEEFQIELDPEDRERLDFVDRQIAEDEDKVYRKSLVDLKGENPDHFPEAWGEDELVKVLSPFVVAAPEELDDDEALAYGFERYREAYSLIHGGEPGTEEAAAQAAANLTPEQIAAINAKSGGPPVITGGQNASVPGEKKYESIAEAAKDFGAELAARNAAPPVV